MIDLECPHCGRAGSAPNDKVNVRLVCRKCHMAFHLNPSGRTVAGDPLTTTGGHDKGHARAGHPAAPAAALSPRDLLARFGAGPFIALIVVGLSGLLGAGYLFMFRGASEPLSVRAKQMAEAVAAEKWADVQSFLSSDIKSPGMSGEFDRYAGFVRTMIATLKRSSTRGEVLATVAVTRESRYDGEGTVEMFFAPAKGTERAEKIATDAGVANDSKAKELTTRWVLERGQWCVDIRQTLETPGGLPMP